MTNKREVYIAGDGSKLVIQGLKRDLENSNYEVFIFQSEAEQLTYIPDAPIHLIICLSDNIKSNFFKVLKDKVLKYGIHVYIAGNKNILTIDDQDYIKDIPSFSFATYPIDKNLLLRAINWNSRERKRILVVDDDPILLRNIKSWLDTYYEVYLVNSGYNAIEFLMKHSVDLVLLDYEMPDLNGPEVLKKFRIHKESAKLPVMFLTSKDDRESVMAAIEQKANGYILKSRSPQEIINIIKDFFLKYVIDLEDLQ